MKKIRHKYTREIRGRGKNRVPVKEEKGEPKSRFQVDSDSDNVIFSTKNTRGFEQTHPQRKNWFQKIDLGVKVQNLFDLIMTSH